MANISSTDLRPHFVRTSSRLSTFQRIHSQLIRCDIVFGMPSQDCRGTGICRLTSDCDASYRPKNDCRNTVAFACRAGEGDRIALVFFREFLCAQLYSRHFRKGILEMKESCPLPMDLVKTLDIKGKRLLPGRYRIQEQDGCFLVEVDCAAI